MMLNFKYLFKILCSFLLVCNFSCGGRQSKLEHRLSETIESYLMENSEPGFQIDSLKILHIDSLSDYHYLLFVEKQVAENYLYQMNFRYNSFSEEGNTLEMEQKQLAADRINETINRIEMIDKRLTNPKTDSLNLKYFFTAVKVYAKKDDKILEPVYYGFPITTDFKVVESEAIPD